MQQSTERQPRLTVKAWHMQFTPRSLLFLQASSETVKKRIQPIWHMKMCFCWPPRASHPGRQEPRGVVQKELERPEDIMAVEMEAGQGEEGLKGRAIGIWMRSRLRRFERGAIVESRGLREDQAAQLWRPWVTLLGHTQRDGLQDPYSGPRQVPWQRGAYLGSAAGAR